MKAQLTVFVCSTYSDLGEEREAVLDAIRRLQLQHDSMEFFGARSGQPLETCLEEVRHSNILVVIVGHRYGSLVPELGVSYSEAEYAEGYKLRKPCLVYIRDDNFPILPKHMERNPDKLRLLENWKTTLQKRHTVASFRESRDLAVQVAADLGRTINELNEVVLTREEARTEFPVQLVDEITRLINEAVENGVAEAALLSSMRRAISAVISESQHLGPSVFLSYANSDRQIVKEIALVLEKRGIRIWFDMSSLKVGSNWAQEIERALDSADFVVFFISPSSVQKGWAQKELQIALHRQVSGEGGPVILPVLLEHAEVPPLLRDIHWLDMTNINPEEGALRIIDTINHHLMPQFVSGDYTAPPSRKIAKQKIVSVLEEERGIVGASAKRLGVSPKRLYELLKYYNIQAREFR